MKIKDILKVEAIKTDLGSVKKEDVIKELVDVLDGSSHLEDKPGIVKSLIERENLGSTGIGQGIAIPHGKTNKVTTLVAAVGVSKQGVDFKALDGEPVYLFFLLVAPKESAGPHLKALARISRLLRDSYFCGQLRKAQTSEEVMNLLVQEDERKS
jgi:PTS system nitrogen regulatory IIA component